MHLGTAIFKAGPEHQIDRILYTPRTFSVKAREAKKLYLYVRIQLFHIAFIPGCQKTVQTFLIFMIRRSR